jgi:UDP-N-acetylmuramate dehydrogenase
MNETYLRICSTLRNKAIRNYPLSSLNTWRIGGPVDILCEPSDTNELLEILDLLSENCAPWWLIGNGSNVLFPDSGLRGVVVKLCGEFKEIKVTDDSIIAGAASTCSRLTRVATECGLSGLEFASGIPATLGGMLKMNAGAYNQEIGDITINVKSVGKDGCIRDQSSSDLDFAYRSCNGLSNTIALSAELKLTKDCPDMVRAKTRLNLENRMQSQPLSAATCGSVFKRPHNDFPGRLIEECGLKGYSIGAARVSPMHANFFENTGSASADDMLELVEFVKKNVYADSGIRLVEEFQYVC